MIASERWTRAQSRMCTRANHGGGAAATVCASRECWRWYGGGSVGALCLVPALSLPRSHSLFLLSRRASSALSLSFPRTGNTNTFSLVPSKAPFVAHSRSFHWIVRRSSVSLALLTFSLPLSCRSFPVTHNRIVSSILLRWFSQTYRLSSSRSTFSLPLISSFSSS